MFFWGFLLIFAIVMYLVAPRATNEAGFFSGHDEPGRPSSEWALMTSTFSSRKCTKSVANAANLGAAHAWSANWACFN